MGAHAWSNVVNGVAFRSREWPKTVNRTLGDCPETSHAAIRRFYRLPEMSPDVVGRFWRLQNTPSDVVGLDLARRQPLPDNVSRSAALRQAAHDNVARDFPRRQTLLDHVPYSAAFPETSSDDVVLHFPCRETLLDHVDRFRPCRETLPDEVDGKFSLPTSPVYLGKRTPRSASRQQSTTLVSESRLCGLNALGRRGSLVEHSCCARIEESTRSASIACCLLRQQHSLTSCQALPLASIHSKAGRFEAVYLLC
jgi:hypothetical protein